MLEGNTLEELLEARGDPMRAMSSPWLRRLARVPKTASAPLAMSGPHPRAVGSYGAECLKWAKSELGVTARWWQALAITRQLEHDKHGELVYREIVESGSRRIGKSTRLRAVALWRIAHADRFREPQLAMLVSKDLAVGKEIHRPAWAWAEKRYPPWNVLRLNGAQEVETPTGDRWLLRAPNAAYGYDVGYGQVDESWDVDPMAITDGIEPALLERESPQLHLTSTAHVRASSLMRRRLLAALRDADPDVLLLMWGARPGADWADEATWRASSAFWSKARRDLIARKYAAALAGEDEPEFDDPDPVRGWAAQYLNVWPLLLAGSGGGVLDLAKWATMLDPKAKRPRSGCVVIDVSPDRKRSSVGVAGPGRKGRTLLIEETAAGTSWVVPKVKRLTEKRDIVEVALHPGSQAGALIPELVEAGVEFEALTTGEMGRACSAFQTGVTEGRFVHVGQSELDAAVENATTRTVGEAELWDRRDRRINISPLVAVSTAAYRWAMQDSADYDVLDSIG